MSSVSPNFLLWSRTRLQPQAPAAAEGGSGAAFTAGRSRSQGRSCRPGRTLCPRARSVLLVSVLWLRSTKTPEPRKPDSAARRSAGTSGQVTAEEHPPPRPEHKKATNKFWWENKANAQMKEKFLISPQDYARFKKSMVKSLDSYEEKEDEVIKEMAAQIREIEQSRQEVVRSVLEPQAEPDPDEGSSALGSWEAANGLAPLSFSHVASSSQQVSHLDPQRVPELDWMETGQHLTFIGHQDTPGVGNIHSGATPPWMIQEEEHSSGNLPIGPSYEEFLKEKEKQKLKKLPPERVGANFDHSSNTSAGWLPSFGRVWNNGRRWQSRHQFKTEAATRSKQSHKGKS
ncbi:coiled-coil domain-containing protein 84 isoform X3 [Cricetulus griseus]|uniref:Coiled-coil domain-containing protein 84 isoform X3 n=1 Tax=Cricetulus griseus TaxID=10029 RepID=A0A9J7GV64_CRIGR|nr:coiled-coil domain-containing protein 84 isoform X3 [Cricetulus griseus]XP_035317769.1 coiled-coil domain-containing protein 84 isoform X3 [Cricetulus griseus]